MEAAGYVVRGWGTERRGIIAYLQPTLSRSPPSLPPEEAGTVRVMVAISPPRGWVKITDLKWVNLNGHQQSVHLKKPLTTDTLLDTLIFPKNIRDDHESKHP